MGRFVEISACEGCFDHCRAFWAEKNVGGQSTGGGEEKEGRGAVKRAPKQTVSSDDCRHTY